ncbi:MAG: VCBS repeat-containing protein [Pyrinomonadaceae bacterium]|nr:VCBS repeat-containing protein [Pyrinomonadaceae bacterium]
MESSRILKTSLVVFAFVLVVSAGAFEAFAQKVRLRAQINPPCATSSRLKFADIYADGNIAVQGSYNCRGAFIYDISNPDNPVLASWYNPGANIQFLEAIVVGNRGYFGSGNGFGVHIVDLTDPYNPIFLGKVDASSGNGHNSIHEMMVWGNYLIENFNGFSSKIIKFINISNPANPVFVRDLNPTEVNWVHAMHIRGNRMFTSGWGNSSNRARTEIYDISNIASQAPTLLGFIEDQTSVTAGNSMHSSWSSEDGNYLYSCRETTSGNGDVRVYNITNPAQPLLVKSIRMDDLGLNAVTPHNPVVVGNLLYVAWYQAGLQVFDISIPSDPKRVGQYDTYQPVFAPSDDEKERALNSDPWDIVCGSDELQNILPTTYDGNWAVYPFLGQDTVLLGDLTNGLIVVDASRVMAPAKNQVSDFDGDGKTDLSVYRPQSGTWSIENSSNSNSISTNFGLADDKLVSGDYDGDGRSDIAVWRPSTGVWYVLKSTGGFLAQQFGAAGDIPVPGDFDADGKTDLAVWRPSTGVWYVQQSSLGVRIVKWGSTNDLPLVGDYEGDGKADMTVFRPSTGVWYVLRSSSSLPIVVQFGLGSDKPVSADFDGDAISDFAVYRPSEGNWYILRSETNSISVIRFGSSADTPIPSDFDGDGKADIAVFRASENNWYRLDSSNGAFNVRAFGQSGDLPSPGSAQP